MMPYKRRQQHLGEVDGLNTGGQLRRARDGDDDEEALAAGVPTINAGEPPASSLALAVGAAAAACLTVWAPTSARTSSGARL